MTTQPKQRVGDEDDDYHDDDLLPEPTGEHPRNASKTTATLEVGDSDQSQDHGDEPDSRVLSEEVSESQAHHHPGEASSVHGSPTAAKCFPNAIQQQPMSLHTGRPRDSESSGDDRDFGPSGGDECANYDYDGGGDYGDDNNSVAKGQSPPTPSRGKDSSLIGVLNGAASIRPKRDQPRSGEDETTAKRQRVRHKQQETECAATQVVQDQGQSQGMQTDSLGEAEAKTELERKISALKAWQQNLKEHFKKMAGIEEESIRSLECLEKELDDKQPRTSTNTAKPGIPAPDLAAFFAATRWASSHKQAQNSLKSIAASIQQHISEPRSSKRPAARSTAQGKRSSESAVWAKAISGFKGPVRRWILLKLLRKRTFK
ncbi:hypothetical protein CEP54_013596 [Fusarium duplospermum]|uniref:Uncharacterized protein n=1 Tax=Fusarium duplospermum TaxID=1325734 RepID=A0A428P1V4_9HYPO|nr:hypothetical protein CEP54_013596 [Fusarium duplospermum]